jgi:hypothetical protein
MAGFGGRPPRWPRAMNPRVFAIAATICVTLTALCPIPVGRALGVYYVSLGALVVYFIVLAPPLLSWCICSMILTSNRPTSHAFLSGVSAPLAGLISQLVMLFMVEPDSDGAIFRSRPVIGVVAVSIVGVLGMAVGAGAGLLLIRVVPSPVPKTE